MRGSRRAGLGRNGAEFFSAAWKRVKWRRRKGLQDLEERKKGGALLLLVPPLRRGKKKEKVATSHLKAAWYFSGGLSIKEGSEFPFYILSSPSPFSHKQLPKEEKHACVKLSSLPIRFFSAAPPPTGTRRKTFHIRFFSIPPPKEECTVYSRTVLLGQKKGKAWFNCFIGGREG